MDQEEKKTCAGCRYFYQHYVWSTAKQYVEVNCGHCTHPMCKERTPEHPACKRFAKR